MADEQTPETVAAPETSVGFPLGHEAEPPPAPSETITNQDAQAQARAIFAPAESGLAAALSEAQALGAHDEYASLRGTLKTALEILRAGRPGGN